MESSGYSSKTLRKGSCPYAPLDEVLRYRKVVSSRKHILWTHFLRRCEEEFEYGGGYEAEKLEEAIAELNDAQYMEHGRDDEINSDIANAKPNI